MKVPFFILLAKEHADAFRRSVELFCEYNRPSAPRGGWHDLWTVVRPFIHDRPYVEEPYHVDVPRVVERALVWANSKPRPPADVVRQAVRPLETALAEWAAAWTMIGKFLKSDGGELHENHWLRDAVSLAMVAHQRAERSFAEGWPVGAEEGELKALEEMRAGSFVELDDAFSRIAGVPKEEWLRRVQAHAGRAVTPPDGDPE